VIRVDERSFGSRREVALPRIRVPVRVAGRVRAAVLTIKTYKALDKHLCFRHAVRNIYTFECDPDRLGGWCVGWVLFLVESARNSRFSRVS